MDDNYYLPVSRSTYDRFIQEYPADRLIEINQRTKKVQDFYQLGAGLLVNQLKDPKDRFTSLVPSEKTKEFKSNAYAVTEDLGIEGKKIKEAFEITGVQKHSEAYAKGVRPGDVLLAINGEKITSLSEEAVLKQLSPILGSFTRLEIFFSTLKKMEVVTLESRSYFKETVSSPASGIDGVLILKIGHFNQKTSIDFSDHIASYGPTKIRHLIVDLRDNSGGPPLAAREILGFFLPPDDPLFAIARKKKRPVMLTAPAQPTAYHGPLTVLVNQKTGSAAELFSGLVQAKKIGDLVGQKTAGATYLKSIYDLDGGSAIFMITSLTFFYDRRVYPPEGLDPDTVLAEDKDSLKVVLESLGQK